MAFLPSGLLGLFSAIGILGLTGCADLARLLLRDSTPAASPSAPTTEGISAGISAVPGVIVDGVSALESGGWAAAAVVTALGLMKASVKGWRAAEKARKAKRLGEIAEAVKKANGTKRAKA